MASFGTRLPADPAGVEALLGEGLALRAAGSTAKAWRALARVVEATEAPDAALSPPERAGLQSAALLALGDLALAAGDRAGAVGAYHRAAGLAPVPPAVGRLLAEDAAARGDVSPAGLWHLARDVATSGRPPESDPVAAYVHTLCWPPAGAPPAAHQLAEALTRQIVAFAPGAEWAHLARGMALVALQQPAAAFVALQEAERWGPWRAATPYQLGLLHEAMGEPEQAADAFRRAAARDGTRAEPLAALGRVCLDAADRHPEAAEGHVAAAVDALEQACRLSPRDAASWHRLGLARARTDPEAAREPLRVASDLEPDDPCYANDRAVVLAGLGAVDEAIAGLRRPVAAGTADPVTTALLGRLLVDTERYADAEPVLLEALRRAPGDRAAGIGLARCLVATDRPDRAVPVLSWIGDRTAAESHVLGRAHALAGDPDAAAAVLADALRTADAHDRPRLARTLAAVHARRGAWTDAAGAADAAREGADAGADAELDLLAGVAHHRAGDLARAAAHLEAACAAAPDDPRAHCARGALLLDRGDRAAAAAAFDRALALGPEHADAWFGRGVVLEQEGDPGAAAAAYARGVAARPGWVPARRRLATIALDAGRPADALAALDGAPDVPELAALRALALARRGDHAAASAAWTALRDGGDTDPTTAANLRLCADHLAVEALGRGDLAAAREHWESCRAEAPDEPRYRAALAEVCLRTAVAGHDGSGALLDRAAALLPDDPRPPRLRARRALLGGAPATARDLLAALPAHDAASAYHRALAEAMDGRLAQARRVLAAAPDGPSPLDPLPGVLRAAVDAADGRFADALAGFRAALAGPVPDGVRDALFAAVARCAAELGTPGAAVEALTPFAADPAARRHLGPAHAALGDADAVRELLLPLDADAPPAVRSAVAWAHRTRARQHADAGDLAAAATATEAAVAADPDDPAVGATRARAVRWRAAVLEAAGRPAEALAVRAAGLDDTPTDLDAVHRVAVLARRVLVAEPPGTGTGGDPDGEPTHLLVAGWAAVLASPAFWTGLQARTGRPVASAERADTRRRFGDELARLLHDRAAAGGPGEADDVAWGLELRAATAVAESGVADGMPGWTPGFACGPILLDRMARRSAEGARLAGALRAAAAAAVPARGLAVLLGPLGRARHLLDGGRLEAAVADLDGHTGPEADALRAEALPALAVARAEEGAWEPATAAFLRAAEVGADLTGHADLLRRSALKQVEQWGDADDGARRAVTLLEAVHGLVPPDPEFDARLAAAYARLAREVNNGDDYEQAVTLVRKALALTPDDPDARHYATVAMANLAHALVRDGDAAALRRGLALFREALTHVDGDAAAAERTGVANVLFGLARARMDEGHFPTAVVLLTEALVHEDDGVTRRFLAGAHQRLGRHDDAVAVLREGHARLPDDAELTQALADALGRRAAARARAGDRDGGRADLAEAAALAADDPRLTAAGSEERPS